MDLKISDQCPVYASFFGHAGVAAAMIFSSIGAAYGTAKAGIGIAGAGTFRPELIMKSLLPVVMAGIIAVYGLVISVLICGSLDPNKSYSLFTGFIHLGSGLTVGLAGLGAGYSIGAVGDAFVRAYVQQTRLFVSMVLMLIFAEVLGLYGLIVGLILNTKASRRSFERFKEIRAQGVLAKHQTSRNATPGQKPNSFFRIGSLQSYSGEIFQILKILLMRLPPRTEATPHHLLIQSVSKVFRKAFTRFGQDTKITMEQIEHPDVLIDSLPYIDQEIDYEGMRAKVDKLVEQEMRKRPSQSKRDYASHFPSNFELFKESPILAIEYQRVQQGKPITEMDTSRYKLIEPDDKEDDELWKKAVDNSNAQLYHQNLRFFNLELLQKFGPNSWKLHNYQLEHELQQFQRTLEDYRQRVLELNKRRKAEQIQAGSQVEALENKWTELIGQTLQLE
ncbi:13446_t:CDS:10, partial [Dentiscutata heterogama]